MKVAVTQGFDNSTVVGYLELTDEFAKIYQDHLVASNSNKSERLVLSPAFISDFPDENGVINKATLIGMSFIPSSHLPIAHNKE